MCAGFTVCPWLASHMKRFRLGREEERYTLKYKHIYINTYIYISMSNCMYVCVYVCMHGCMVWYGMVWYGMVWYGMVWYGMVWYGMVLYVGMHVFVCAYVCMHVCMHRYIGRPEIYTFRCRNKNTDKQIDPQSSAFGTSQFAIVSAACLVGTRKQVNMHAHMNNSVNCKVNCK